MAKKTFIVTDDTKMRKNVFYVYVTRQAIMMRDSVTRSVMVAGSRTKTEENTRMKERDLACCYCRLSGRINGSSLSYC